MTKKYKGYLNGVNPNYTRKVLQDDDPRYFSIDTGRFVNGKGEELKTMAEAVKVNDKIDKEYKEAWPPQKAIGAKPVRDNLMLQAIRNSSTPVKGYVGGATPVKKPVQQRLFQDIFDKNGLRRTPKTESEPSVNRRTWQKVEKNRAKGKADYEDFQDHEIIVAESYRSTKKLQKEITDNLNEYLKNKIPEIVQQTPTPSFISSPQPKSKGIADTRLVADIKLKNEILNGE